MIDLIVNWLPALQRMTKNKILLWCDSNCLIFRDWSKIWIPIWIQAYYNFIRGGARNWSRKIYMITTYNIPNLSWTKAVNNIPDHFSLLAWQAVLEKLQPETSAQQLTPINSDGNLQHTGGCYGFYGCWLPVRYLAVHVIRQRGSLPLISMAAALHAGRLQKSHRRRDNSLLCTCARFKV